MSLNYNEIGKNIREVRKENGLSQAMLSELVEKSPSYISYIAVSYTHLTGRFHYPRTAPQDQSSPRRRSRDSV